MVIFHPWGRMTEKTYWLRKKHFCFSYWDVFSYEASLVIKKDQNMKTEVLWAKQKVQSKSSGMKHGFLSQKTLFLILVTRNSCFQLIVGVQPEIFFQIMEKKVWFDLKMFRNNIFFIRHKLWHHVEQQSYLLHDDYNLQLHHLESLQQLCCLLYGIHFP